MNLKSRLEKLETKLRENAPSKDCICGLPNVFIMKRGEVAPNENETRLCERCGKPSSRLIIVRLIESRDEIIEPK